MDQSINLSEIVEKHGKWLRDEKGGERWSCPIGANLRRADLSDADLSGANLRRADLSGADLSGADLSGADLRRADLSGADLSGADLSDANLSGADLSDANLSGANLSGADLSGADLSGADLSGAKNFFNPIKWMSENFEHDDLGFIVYKTFGAYYKQPEWKIEAGSFIEENVNPLPTNDCGCGINFATIKWIKNDQNNPGIWRCRIHWMDCVGVVIPYNTDGKARCSRLELIGII